LGEAAPYVMQADDSEGAPAHWQSVIRAQFTSAGYVMLALSVAALGFQMVFVLNAQFDAGDPWQRAALVAALLALLVLFLSVAMGLFLVVNRVRDLRATLLAARSSATESLGSASCRQRLATPPTPRS